VAVDPSSPLALVTTFPVVVYTVLLGAAVIYWLFVTVGAVSLDDGHDVGASGGDHAHAGDAWDGGGDHHHGDHHGPSGLAGMLESLKLRSAPATVVVSVLVLFSWILSLFGMEAASALLPVELLFAARGVVLVLAPLLALVPTSFAIRPLAKIFVPAKAARSQDLVGKVCTIRTGTVTDRFGEASLEDGGAGLVVRVRVESGEKLARGQQAVILGYDPDRHEFTVAPMDDVLEPREGVEGEDEGAGKADVR
jgi:hypothetical protein